MMIESSCATRLAALAPMARFSATFFLLLLVDVAVADIGADKDRTAVRAVEFLLLFEEREVFADRDLRNLEQLGQLHDGYGAVLLQQCQDPVMTLRKLKIVSSPDLFIGRLKIWFYNARYENNPKLDRNLPEKYFFRQYIVLRNEIL